MEGTQGPLLDALPSALIWLSCEDRVPVVTHKTRKKHTWMRRRLKTMKSYRSSQKMAVKVEN
jgi:hypothetical protein